MFFFRSITQKYSLNGQNRVTGYLVCCVSDAHIFYAEATTTISMSIGLKTTNGTARLSRANQTVCRRRLGRTSGGGAPDGQTAVVVSDHNVCRRGPRGLESNREVGDDRTVGRSHHVKTAMAVLKSSRPWCRTDRVIHIRSSSSLKSL